MTQALLKQLKQTHLTMRDMAKQLNDESYRTQYHQDLSPFGWHIGHCAYIETYWLREFILKDDSITNQLEWLYIPENIIKPKRGPALPPMQEHLAWCATVAEENSIIFKQAPSLLENHKLSKDNYILKFILQHHSQHIETMAMVLVQRQLQLKPTLAINQPLSASKVINVEFVDYPAGEFKIGSPFKAEAFDNELPPQQVKLEAFKLANSPVTNANWLAFIEDKGYQNKKFWSQDGWEWRLKNNINQPESWLTDSEGYFYEASSLGARELGDTDAVSGINYFEANAFVQWLKETSAQYAKIRLPHEYEWEVADQSEQLNRSGEVWEWCENHFHPYPGFSAFPYENYSKPWFDGKHFSLRGSSEYTQACIRRSSFRNFYNPDKRHIFAGMRLAMSTG